MRTLLVFCALAIASPAVAAPIPVKVVVVTMFEPGEDTGDRPGWYTYLLNRLK
jgi:hypothetical protein